MVGKYKVITLCGSTRFKDAFLESQKRLTLEGNIVISVGLFGHSGDKEVWTEGTKEMLDDMHKRKIDMADEIFVINVGGYIGFSTRSEIQYAEAAGKEVKYLYPPKEEKKMKETIIRQYRKKPVIVEAVQLNNLNMPSVVRWIGEDKAKMKLESDEAWKLGKAPPIFSITISTLEGDMKAMPGDYIIKGVGGEFYPCKSDIFEKTYEAVEPLNEKEKICENCYWKKWYRGDLYCTHVGLKTNVNSSCRSWKPEEEA